MNLMEMFAKYLKGISSYVDLRLVREYLVMKILQAAVLPRMVLNERVAALLKQMVVMDPPLLLVKAGMVVQAGVLVETRAVVEIPLLLNPLLLLMGAVHLPPLLGAVHLTQLLE